MSPLQIALLCLGLAMIGAACLGHLRSLPVPPITEEDLSDAFCNAPDGSDEQARAHAAWAGLRDLAVAA